MTVTGIVEQEMNKAPLQARGSFFRKIQIFRKTKCVMNARKHGASSVTKRVSAQPEDCGLPEPVI